MRRLRNCSPPQTPVEIARFHAVLRGLPILPRWHGVRFSEHANAMTILLSRLVLCTTMTLLHLWAGVPVWTSNGYQPGDKLRAMQGCDFTKPSATLVISCAKTARRTSSMEFYKSPTSTEHRARIVAMSYDAPETLSETRRARFEADQAVSVRRTSGRQDAHAAHRRATARRQGLERRALPRDEEDVLRNIR